MIRRPPRSTRTDTLFPYTTLFQSFLHSEVFGLALEQFTQFAVAVQAGIEVRPYLVQISPYRRQIGPAQFVRRILDRLPDQCQWWCLWARCNMWLDILGRCGFGGFGCFR